MDIYVQSWLHQLARMMWLCSKPIVLTMTFSDLFEMLKNIKIFLLCAMDGGNFVDTITHLTHKIMTINNIFASLLVWYSWIQNLFHVNDWLYLLEQTNVVSTGKSSCCLTRESNAASWSLNLYNIHVIFHLRYSRFTVVYSRTNVGHGYS